METTNPSAIPTTSSWKIGHATIQIIHLVWIVIQLIYHFAMMISYYQNGIAGYATADLLIILACAFFFFNAGMGLFALFIPEMKVSPVIVGRMVKVNTMSYVFGMQYLTFIYLLMWITELAHTPFLLNFGSLTGFTVSTVLAFVHPGISIILFVIQFIIGVIGAFTSINYYLFTEKIRVGRILAPYKAKTEQGGVTTTVIVQQQSYQPQQVGYEQPQQMYAQPTTAQYYPQQQQDQQMYAQPQVVYQQPIQPIAHEVKIDTSYTPVQQQYVSTPVPVENQEPVVDQGMVEVAVEQ